MDGLWDSRLRLAAGRGETRRRARGGSVCSAGHTARSLWDRSTSSAVATATKGSVALAGRGAPRSLGDWLQRRPIPEAATCAAFAVGQPLTFLAGCLVRAAFRARHKSSLAIPSEKQATGRRAPALTSVAADYPHRGGHEGRDDHGASKRAGPVPPAEMISDWLSATGCFVTRLNQLLFAGFADEMRQLPTGALDVALPRLDLLKAGQAA